MNDDELRATAQERHDLHQGHPSHRPLSPDYEEVGLRAERLFVREFPHLKLEVDRTKRPRGDGGLDFIVPWRTSETVWKPRRLDVKGAHKPANLLIEQGHIHADVYVLVGISDQDGDGLIAWAFGHELAAIEPRPWPFKVVNHILPAHQAHSIRELRARLAPPAPAPDGPETVP